MNLFVLVLGIIFFICLIIVHELGHFIVAIRNGVEAEEFGIFFGPTLFKHKTKKGWIFKINLLPLGGYVKLKGEHDTDTQPGSYGASSLWVKTKIMSAGVFSNFILGVIFLLILCFLGIPQLIPNQFGTKSDQYVVSNPNNYLVIQQVLKDSPAAQGNLKAGYKIVSLGINKYDQTKIYTFIDLQNLTKKYQGQRVEIYYSYQNKISSTFVKMNSTQEIQNNSKNHQKFYLGVAVNQFQSGYQVLRYTWTAPIVALGTTKQIIVLTFDGLGHALKGLFGIFSGLISNNQIARKNAQTTASNQLVGPVGIFVILKDGSANGILFMLFIIAIISLTLAIMNILPIPALDGGRLWFTLLFRSIKKPLNQRNEEILNATGFLILLLLLGVVTYLDIKRFF